MAIKSKGRTRGHRSVAAAPRRPLVVRKPPVWRRPWVWIVIGLLAVGGITWGLLSAMSSNNAEAKTKRETSAMNRLFVQFQGALPPDLQAVPPDVLVIFPSVTSDLPTIGKEIKGNAVRQRGQEISDQATAAVAEIQAIDVNKIIPAEFPEDRAAVTDGLFLIAKALGLYEQVGGIIEASADLPRADQKALIDQATALTQQAGGLFDEGYRKLLAIGNRLGVSPNIPNPAPPIAPPASPTASPTASTPASAEPTPTASG
jgi:hypothetical protein